jgi:hypothetical protein
MTFATSVLGITQYVMLILAIFVPTNALADDCRGARFHFCENCDTQISITVNKDVACSIFIHRSDGYEMLKIVGRPKHGRVGMEETTLPHHGKKSYAAHILYVPEKGFSGVDSYVLHAVFFHGAGRYETNANVSITVK